MRSTPALASRDTPTATPLRAREMADVAHVEGLIFDLDGTLIDYEGASHTALARPLEARGYSLSWEVHASIVGTKPEDWSRNVLAQCGVPAEVLTPAQYVDEYFEAVKSLYATISAWPGTLDLVTAFQKAGFPMAIATSSPRASFDVKMQYHASILTKMAAVVTGDEVSRGKPAPDIFLEAARRLGCDPSRCIVFEDSPLGIEGAHAAGCLAVALPDSRFPTLLPRFGVLRPRWVLSGDIGTFDAASIVRRPPSRRSVPGGAANSISASRLACAAAAAVAIACIAGLLRRNASR